MIRTFFSWKSGYQTKIIFLQLCPCPPTQPTLTEKKKYPRIGTIICTSFKSVKKFMEKTTTLFCGRHAWKTGTLECGKWFVTFPQSDGTNFCPGYSLLSVGVFSCLGVSAFSLFSVVGTIFFLWQFCLSSILTGLNSGVSSFLLFFHLYWDQNVRKLLIWQHIVTLEGNIPNHFNCW